MNKNYTGAALCCGQVPKFGHHNLHVWKGKKEHGFGFYCPICEKAVSFLGSESMAFGAKIWNETFQPCECNEGIVIEPKIDAPEGYRWAQFDISYSYVGGTSNKRFDFILFKTSHPDILDKRRDYKNRNLKDLSVIWCGKEINLDWICSARDISVWCNSAWSTANMSHYILNIDFCNTAYKRIKKFGEDTGILVNGD